MRKVFFTFLYRIGIHSLLRIAKKNKVTVLNLHRISNENDYFFPPITPERFDQLLNYCTKKYSIISYNQMNTKTKKPKLILSFDDGYSDFMEYAIPILNKYKIPSNHNFVNQCLNDNTPIWTQLMNDIFNYLRDNNIIDDDEITKYAGSFIKNNSNWIKYYSSFFQKMMTLKKVDRDQIISTLINRYQIENKLTMMTWDDVKTCLTKYNVEIGSHTYSHEVLSTIKDNYSLEFEIEKSINELETKLKTKIETLAIPNGMYSESNIEYFQKSNLKRVLLVNDKTCTIVQNNNELNLINRIYLINEPISEMILRLELFHSKFR